jgi:hypothetical protein
MTNACNEEGKDCHLKITIMNKTNQDIIRALKMKNTFNKCILSGSIIKPNDIFELRLNECWESSLANGQTEEIYIVDPNNYNTPGIFYDCDSIELKNTILKHYVLTLEDLKNSNFTVTYP